jgi:hypothetical protein
MRAEFTKHPDLHRPAQPHLIDRQCEDPAVVRCGHAGRTGPRRDGRRVGEVPVDENSLAATWDSREETHCGSDFLGVAGRSAGWFSASFSRSERWSPVS